MTETNSTGYGFFSLMVVGDNPEEMMKEYSSEENKKTYVKFKFADMPKLRKNAIKMAKKVIESAAEFDISDDIKEYFKAKVKTLESLSDFEYYNSLTDGMEYDEEGNAIANENPNAKFSSYRIGRNMCIPLTMKDGSHAFQAKAADVDWEAMNMNVDSVEQYKRLWMLGHDEAIPEKGNETDEILHANAKAMLKYFSNFKNMDDFVKYSCSYWNYAILDKDGWKDADDITNFEWITGFYDNYVKKLNPDDMVTIYECTKI